MIMVIGDAADDADADDDAAVADDGDDNDNY